MAKYTIELKTLVNSHYPLALNSYPIFDEDYRETLNNKIIAHFWFNEIGSETADRFNFYLNRKMYEIMPYYNQLYLSCLIEFDPFITNIMNNQTKTSKKGKTFHDTVSNFTELENKRDSEDNKGSETFKSDLKNDTSNVKNGNNTEEKTEVEHVDNNSTTTNDLQTHTVTKNTGEGTNTTTGSKHQVFSDIPQTAVNLTTTVKSNGDIDYNINGYETTATTDSTRENSTTKSSETGDSTTDNTGTVKVVGESDRNLSGNKTNTFNETIVGNLNQNEAGTTNSEFFNIKNSNTTKNSGNKINNLEDYFENLKNRSESSGRVGFSPSKLLKEYRETFLNIDMMIINDLENLFMEVY